MTRVTASDVRDIAEFELDDLDLGAFIDDANQIINSRVAAHVDEDTARLMEKWLAAHLAAMREKRVSSSSTGNTEVSYEGETGQGLSATRYGQQVLALDPSGLLQAQKHHTNTTHSSEMDNRIEDGPEYPSGR